MIRYTLACDRGDSFESWFKDSAAYDEQAARGFLACPICGSAKVEKAIMAPQVARSDREAASAPVALVPDKELELRAKVKQLYDELTQNSEFVGKRFAEEARKIHFGETEHRSIHGQASAEEARLLAEEGVDFMPLPALPDERN